MIQIAFREITLQNELERHKPGNDEIGPGATTVVTQPKK